MKESYTITRIITQESGDAVASTEVFTDKNGGRNKALETFHDKIADAINKQRYCDTITICDQFGAYVEDPYTVQNAPTVSEGE